MTTLAVFRVTPVAAAATATASAIIRPCYECFAMIKRAVLARDFAVRGSADACSPLDTLSLRYD